MNRNLVTVFLPYNVSQFLKKHELESEIMLFDPNSYMTLKTIGDLILLGNPSMKDLKSAYEKYSEYLKISPDNNIRTAYCEIVRCMEEDLGIMSAYGITYKEFEEDLNANISSLKNRESNKASAESGNSEE